MIEPQEKGHPKVSTFTGRYKDTMMQPFVVYSDRSNILWFTFNEGAIDNNVEVLASYLEDPSIDLYDSGRSMLAEIVMVDIFNALYPNLEESMSFLLTPSDIDASQRRTTRKGCYQKGSDIYLTRTETVQGEYYDVHRPLLGIDVSLGSDKTIQKKLNGTIPVQIPTDTPVIILPINGLLTAGKLCRRFASFRDYLDGPARDEVINTGAYTPLTGLTDLEREILTVTLSTSLAHAIEESIKRITFQRSREGPDLKTDSVDKYIQKLRNTKAVLGLI